MTKIAIFQSKLSLTSETVFFYSRNGGVLERIIIFLETPEKDALIALANVNGRDLRDQTISIIREDLIRRGFLKVTSKVQSELDSNWGKATDKDSQDED